MRWSTLLTEPTDLRLTSARNFSRGEAIIGSRPTAARLFENWESNHWDPFSISFEEDRAQWHRMPGWMRDRLNSVIRTFVIGEHTGLDLLSPVLAGAPTESGLRFLATQVADEARHSVFMLRLVEALWDTAAPETVVLADAWTGLSPSYRRLNEIESGFARATLSRPADYSAWIRQVTMFHVVTEGLLAFYGQRALTDSLERARVLPGVKRGFLAMGRDEARHISFGMDALRTGLLEGCGEEVTETLLQVLPLAITVDYFPGDAATAVVEANRTRRALSRLANRRMKQLGFDSDHVSSVMSEVQRRADAQLVLSGAVLS